MGFKKKMLAVAVAGAMSAATAVPALAMENEFHGMYRLFGSITNFNNSLSTEPVGGSDWGFYNPQNRDKKSPTANYIEHRARLMYIAKASDDLKLVTHFEIDSRWGDKSYTNGRNSGGAIGADTVNLETKSVYLDFKCPITGTHVKAGMQPFNDSFKGVLFDADMAGIQASRSFGNLDATLGWFRFNDPKVGTVPPGKQTRDMIALDTKYAVSKDIKVGAAYYMINDDRSTDNQILFQQAGDTNIVHSTGVNAEANLGLVTVDGFFLYQFGNLENIGGSGAGRHVSAFAGNVGAKAKLGPGTLRSEFLYASGDKSGSRSTTNAFQSVDDEHGFYSGNLTLLTRDAYCMTTDNAIAYTVNNKDQGLILGTVGFDMPFTPKLSGSLNAGFAAVAKANANKPLNLNTSAANSSNYLGTEINGEVDYKMYDNMTVIGRAAYVVLGDYYKGVATGGQDPRNPYAATLILNYAF